MNFLGPVHITNSIVTKFSVSPNFYLNSHTYCVHNTIALIHIEPSCTWVITSVELFYNNNYFQHCLCLMCICAALIVWNVLWKLNLGSRISHHNWMMMKFWTGMFGPRDSSSSKAAPASPIKLCVELPIWLSPFFICHTWIAPIPREETVKRSYHR